MPLDFFPAFAAIYFALIIFLCLLLFAKNEEKKSSGLNCTIIIAFHNESQNLKALLSSLFEQDCDLKKCEFIFVDDRSNDNSAEIINAELSKFPDTKLLQITELPKGKFGKKNAIETAIKSAKNEYLIFTDADCVCSRNFISSTLSCFANGADFVLGKAPLKAAGGFASKLSRMETVANHIIAVASLNLSKASLAFGRNMAYKKSSFLEIGGFAKIDASLSGDDDLLLVKFQSAGKKIVFNYDAAVESNTVNNWKDYSIQKTRHFSSLKHSKVKLQLSALSIHLLHLLFYVLILIEQNYWLLVYKSVADLLLFSVAHAHLNFKHLKSNWLYFVAFYWLLIPYFAIKGYISNSANLRWR